jgi:hypothetical protein
VRFFLTVESSVEIDKNVRDEMYKIYSMKDNKNYFITQIINDSLHANK